VTRDKQKTESFHHSAHGGYEEVRGSEVSGGRLATLTLATFRTTRLASFGFAFLCVLCALCGESFQASAAAEPEYLTPVEMKLSADGAKLFVVCEDADSVLAVDTRSRRVAARAKVGHKPRGLALSPDGRTLYVSNSWSDTVSEVDVATLEVKRTLKTGWGPVGLTTDRAGKALYVANSIGDSVSLIDLASGAEIKRFSTHRYPEQVLLSRDGRRVYVANLLPHLGPYDQPPVSELLALDAERQVVAERILIPGAIELRHIAEVPPTVPPASRRRQAARMTGVQPPNAPISDRRSGGLRPPLQPGDLLVALMRPKNLGPLIQVSQGWVLTHGMAVIHPTVSVEATPSQVTQVLLDDIDYSFAGNEGVAFTPDSRLALVTSAEADRVSVIDTAKLSRRLAQVPADELANRLDSAVTFVTQRLATGHNPSSVVISPDGRWAYIANRLDDSVMVIDLNSVGARQGVPVPRYGVPLPTYVAPEPSLGEPLPVIDLGGPKEITPTRRGEQLFHAAKYCFQGQFACATCHPNSHLDGLSWNLETPQLGRDRVANRTLRGIRETAPYKWNGHNPDLATQCGPRIAKYLFRSEGFNLDELEALITYLNNNPLAPNRHLAPDGQLTEAQERGKAIFYRQYTNDGREIPVQNRCDTCHPAATHYTARISTDVATASRYDTNGMFDIPQLDRVYEDAPYLHNGEALTLEEIWTVFNNKDTHGITSDMSKQQLNDLVEFLKTL
jgi:YVTN family beta-propeller protein